MLIPLVAACSTLTPSAEISAVHFTARYYAVAACTEIPHPDHDLGGLTVESVTGAPKEFSSVQQVTFTVPQLAPWQMPGFALNVGRTAMIQKRPLGRPACRIPSRTPGRS